MGLGESRREVLPTANFVCQNLCSDAIFLQSQQNSNQSVSGLNPLEGKNIRSGERIFHCQVRPRPAILSLSLKLA